MEEERGSQPLGWRRRLVVVLVLLTAGSVAARVAFATASASERATTADVTVPPPGMTTLTPRTGQPPPAPTEESPGWRRILPFVTECGVAMLIGLAIGVATRMLAKMVVVAVVLFFLATQFLAYKGFIDVDYGRFWHWMKDFVLNVSAHADLRSIMQHKLPSAGAFLIGYLLGLKRG